MTDHAAGRMTLRKFRNDDLVRAVIIHVTPDGTIYYRERGQRVFAELPTPGNGWRDVAADALRDGKIDETKRLIRDYELGLLEDAEPHEPKGEYGLPVFSVDTVAQAKQLITHFGSLVDEKLPDGQQRYVLGATLDRLLNPGGVECLWEIGTVIAKWYDQRYVHLKPARKLRGAR